MNYFKKLFISITLIYLTLVSINIIVDPYDKMKVKLLHLKIKGVFDHRTNKFLYLDNPNNNYQAFILGSSRAMQLQPSTIEQATGYKTFNYAVFTAMPEDYLAMTKHIIDKQHPKLIILHIDFYAFNESMKPTAQFYESPLLKYLNAKNTVDKAALYIPKNYFSFNALKDSIKVIEKNIKGKIQLHYQKNGENFPQYQDKKDYKLLNEYWNKEYKDFKISPKRVQYLKEIQRICNEHNVKLFVSLSPVSYKHYQKIESDKSLKDSTLKVKKEMCNIFEKYTDFFTDSTQKWSDTKYWLDSVHPTTIMGNILTDDIIKGESNNTKFGKLILCQ